MWTTLLKEHRVFAVSWKKPEPAVAPSRLAVIGRYVFEPEIFDYLETVSAGIGGEIQLTDGIELRLKPCPPTRIALRVRVLTAAASRASLMRLFTLHASVASASADRETN